MDPLSHEEKKEFQDILSYFYGNQAYNWNINKEVLGLLEELLRKNDSCSKYMDLVPRVFYVGNALRNLTQLGLVCRLEVYGLFSKN